MVAFARAIAALGVDVVTFNFLYTEQKRRAPDRAPMLEACYAAAIDAVFDKVESARQSLFIGGKSMGGRIATQVAVNKTAPAIAGIVLLGYPLHPPGRPHERRDAHLPSVKKPMLFVQGSRDAFGAPAELSSVVDALRPAATLHVVDGGDHSFKRPRITAADQAAVYEEIQRTIVAWIGTITRR
jgi:predicted alpha/beta-hydrolase family hydrolase